LEHDSLFAKTLRDQPVDPDFDVEDFRARVLTRVRRDNPDALRNPRSHEGYLRSVAALEPDAVPKVVDRVVKDMLGYGPLQDYIFPASEEYEGINEVMCTTYNLVYVEKNGKLIKTGTRFDNEQHLLTTMRKIVASCGRRLSFTEPSVDAYLPDGSRVNAKIYPSTRPGHSTMTIRRFPRFFTLQELEDSGTITGEFLALLREAVKAGWSCVFSGAMGAGKTTLLNATTSLLKEYWGPAASLVIFEDVPELQPDHENTRYSTGQPPMPDGTGEIKLADLARNELLRLRPDWLVLSECRGAETYYVVQSMMLGTTAFTTVHSTSAIDAALYRLPSLLMMSEEGRAEGYDQAMFRVTVAVDLVIHMAKVRFGDRYLRRVIQVAEVLRSAIGREPDVKVLFQWDTQKKELVQVADTTLYAKDGQVVA
jgi:pilus assembly protein CpaF